MDTVSFKFHLGKLCRHKQVKGLAAQAASWTFTKQWPIENSESDKLLKTFIFMSTVVILYVLRFSVADPMQICLALKRGKHASITLISNCPIKKFTDSQAICGIQCNKILLPLFWLTIKSICIKGKHETSFFAVFVLFAANIPLCGSAFCISWYKADWM